MILLIVLGPLCTKFGIQMAHISPNMRPIALSHNTPDRFGDSFMPNVPAQAGRGKPSEVKQRRNPALACSALC